ncbi:hypothetical protein [Xanthobacter aminoxidans]|uniref:hypothetical protein n=1 Tax=Xanthobacter aminoxidans TaxID=186280 RepID=UPI002022F2DA|nr:hypothetical protein [Xanthobacter aminoxidans]MCL8384224.1 hypothetical protein [Xanthobacter aminoxidans]
MGIGLGFKGLRVAAAALFVLAQLTLGFAHQPVALPSSEAPVDLAAYALPDGTLPDLCLNGADAGTVLKAHPCDACVLTSAPGLAVAPQPALAAPDGRRIAHLPVGCERQPAEQARGAQARGPPVT